MATSSDETSLYTELDNSYYCVISHTDGFAIENKHHKNNNVEGLGKGVWSEVSKKNRASIAFTAYGILKKHFSECGSVYLKIPETQDLKEVVKFILLHSTEADLFQLLRKMAEMDDVAEYFVLFCILIDNAIERLNAMMASIDSVSIGEIKIENTLQETVLDIGELPTPIVINHTTNLEYEDGLKITVKLEDGDGYVVFYIENGDTNKLAEHLIEGLFYAYGFLDACDVLDFIVNALALRSDNTKNMDLLKEIVNCLENAKSACKENGMMML